MTEVVHSKIRSIIVFVIINFLITFGIMIVDIFFPVYISELGFSNDKIGLIWSLSYVIAALFVVFGGNIADRVGKKKIVLTAIIAYLLLDVILLMFKGTISIVVARILYSFGKLCWFTGLFSYLYDVTKEKERGEITGKLFIGALVGLLMSPFVAGLIIEHFSYSILFIISIVILSIGFVLSLFSFKNIKPKNLHKISFKDESKDIITNKNFLKVTVLMGMFTGIVMFFLIFFPIYLREVLGWEYSHIGYLISSVVLLMTLLQEPIAKVLIKNRARYLFLSGNLFLALSNFIIGKIKLFTAVVISRVLVELGNSTLTMKSNILVIHFTPKKEHAGAVAFYQAFNAIFIAITLVFAGKMINFFEL